MGKSEAWRLRSPWSPSSQSTSRYFCPSTDHLVVMKPVPRANPTRSWFHKDDIGSFAFQRTPHKPGLSANSHGNSPKESDRCIKMWTCSLILRFGLSNVTFTILFLLCYPKPVSLTPQVSLEEEIDRVMCLTPFLAHSRC